MKMKLKFNHLIARSFKILLLIACIAIVGCGDDDDGPTPIPSDDDGNGMVDKEIVTVEGILTGEHTWTADKIWYIKGFVRIGDDSDPQNGPISTGILNIEPGTLIIGERASKGTLIVQRGSKIYARGTADNPIVMTSERAPGLKEPGDWGGLVVCGFAPNNNPGGLAELEGNYGGWHGGNDPDDDSGVIEYVRIEYAGVPINPNQEVNTLTMGSVGRGTKISHVMASYGLDDAFEWFGGTVDAKYLIAYRCLDDDLDVDNGYSGNVQFALVIRDRVLADQSGSNAFEVDNDGSGSLAEPFTSGTFSNVTVLGPKFDRETPISLQYQHAMQLRRSSKLKIHNSFLTGFPYGLYLDGANVVQFAQDGDVRLRNVVLAGVEHWGGNGWGGAGDVFSGPPANGAQHPNNPRGAAFRTNVDGFDVEEWFLTAGWGNELLPKWQDAGVDPSGWSLENPKVTPNSGSILLTGANFDGLSNFFDRVPFRGAFGTEDWTAGWAEWNPNIVKYY